MSGSGSGSEFSQTTTKRLREMLQEDAVLRDPRRRAKILDELRRRKGQG